MGENCYEAAKVLPSTKIPGIWGVSWPEKHAMQDA
jgi:hypothetical protein